MVNFPLIGFFIPNNINILRDISRVKESRFLLPGLMDQDFTANTGGLPHIAAPIIPFQPRLQRFKHHRHDPID